jgi:SPX domain protein involved in polyphosphate accumulation
MKFGKVLQQSQQMSSSGWEERWVDYKRLKKIIKDCAQISKDEKLKAAKHPTKIAPSTRTDNESIRESEDEMNFFRTLRAEINKITDFFIKEQAKYTSQVKEIEHTFEELKALPRTNVKTELMKSCVTLYKELLLLENFAVMNFCGISKVCFLSVYIYICSYREEFVA